MATHSHNFAWKIPWTKEPGRLQSMGVAKSQTRLSYFTFTFTQSKALAYSVKQMIFRNSLAFFL